MCIWCDTGQECYGEVVLWCHTLRNHLLNLGKLNQSVKAIQIMVELSILFIHVYPSQKYVNFYIDVVKYPMFPSAHAEKRLCRSIY